MIRNLLIAGGLLLASSPAFAACSIDIDGNDAMQFDIRSIEVPRSCEAFTINLTHSGTLARHVMGHNWVLARTRNVRNIANDGMAAGLEHDYLKPDDDRVIAHTRVIGGGEKTSVTFAVSQLEAEGDYTFFCSFPGHWSVMKGSLELN